MNTQQLIELALEAGFSRAAMLDPSALQPRRDVRDMCRGGCHRYGTCWSCPPGCGTLEQCRQKLMPYRNGLLVQTVAQLEDEFDGQGMMDAQSVHIARFRQLTLQLRPLWPRLLPLGAGCCSICSQCTYPDAPCRFPQQQIASMEAYGLLVQEVCRQSGLAYYYGPNTIAYSSCILLE